MPEKERKTHNNNGNKCFDGRIALLNKRDRLSERFLALLSDDANLNEQTQTKPNRAEKRREEKSRDSLEEK